jgi:hypothetical protein
MPLPNLIVSLIIVLVFAGFMAALARVERQTRTIESGKRAGGK